MTDSLDTSDREAEDPREPIRLPVREMRDEPVPHQAADPIRAALQLALEATPEELPAALSAVRAALAAQQAGVQVPTLPHPGSPEASAMMDSLLAEYQWPSNPKNAARAGFEAARRLLAAAPEAPAQAAPSADEVERGDVVAFEFYNRATGHAIVDYSVNTHVGNLSADKGYEARPLVYADKREEFTDGSKPIPLWQAREALDELEAAARGDAPFNHFAAGLVRSALEQAAAPEAPAQAERDALRMAQAAAVMPLIGPLVDAREGLPNDIALDDELSDLKRIVTSIARAMDADVDQPAPAQPTQGEAPAQAAPDPAPPGFAWVNVNGRPMLARMDVSTSPTVAQVVSAQPTQGEAPSEREAFEAWYFDKYANQDGLRRRHAISSDDYEFHHARDAWEGWQAGRAALATQPQAEAVPVAQVEIVVPHLRSIVVKHILGAPLPKVGDHLYITTPTQASQPQAVDAALRMVADVAHEGGLLGMSEGEALRTVRQLTLPWWDRSRTREQSIAAIDAARRAGGAG